MNRSDMFARARPDMLTSIFGVRPAPKEQMVPYSARIVSSSADCRRVPLDDAVDAGIVRQFENRRCEIVLLASRRIRAEFARNVSFLLAAHRSDDPRAAPFCELHSVSADPARAARHIDGLRVTGPSAKTA